MHLNKLLFVNFYSSLKIDNYTISSLPGKNKRIKGSILGGFNIGINKNISDEKKEATLTVMKYFFSKEFHKEIIVKKLHTYTSLSELYNDTEVCSIINCDMMNKIQFFIRPILKMNNYDSFSDKATKYFQMYLNGEITTEQVLNNIANINRTYYFSIKSTTGTIMAIFLLLIFCIIIFSTCLIFIPKYEIYFKLLSTDLWLIYALGSILTNLSNFGYFNEITVNKCTIRFILSEFGNGLVAIPIFYILLINLSQLNECLKWIKDHRYLFIILLISLHVIFSVLISTCDVFRIKKVIEYDEKHFIMCTTNKNIYGIIINYLQYIYNTFLYLMICILIFFEWNVKKLRNDIRHISFIIIINGITQISYIIIYKAISYNYLIFALVSIIFNIFSICINHIYMFLIRILIKNINKTEDSNNEMFEAISSNSSLKSSTPVVFSNSEFISSTGIDLTSNI